jgi:hypothetical protein
MRKQSLRKGTQCHIWPTYKAVIKLGTCSREVSVSTYMRISAASVNKMSLRKGLHTNKISQQNESTYIRLEQRSSESRFYCWEPLGGRDAEGSIRRPGTPLWPLLTYGATSSTGPAISIQERDQFDMLILITCELWSERNRRLFSEQNQSG